jgi:hypothetical protein
MSVEQAYIEGFVKRAAEYGYSEEEAVNILKRANTQNVVSQQDPMIIPTTPGAPSHIPPYQPKYNKPVQIDPISPEINEQLTGVSPSSMTPKNHWEQGLHDIMAKKPALAAEKTIPREGGPTQLNIAHSHARDIYQAIESINGEYRKKSGFAYIPPEERGIRGVYNKIVNRISPPAPNPNAAHINRLQNHFKQYDPSWGDDIRLPLPANPAGDPDSLKYYNNYKNDFIPSNMHTMNSWRNRQK